MTTRSSASGGLSFVACAFLLIACIALGGGTRQALPAEALLQIFALPFLLLGLFGRGSREFDGRAWLCAGWFAAVAVVLLVQLIPLPPLLWSSLAGRQVLADELELAGVAVGWRPLSLDPQATLRALLAMLAPAAVFVLASKLDLRHRVLLLKLVLLLAVASVALGFAQLAGGPNSPLRWHDVTSATNAVGPFANRNHLASLLAVCLPLSAAWLIAALRQRRQDLRAALMVAAGALLVLLIIGLAVTRSRSGVVLGAAAFVGVAVMVWLHRQRIEPGKTRPLQIRRWLLLAFAVGVVVSMQYGLLDLWGRLRSDPFEDRRWHIAATTIDAIGTFGALGTGAGTFVTVYPSVEPENERGEYYVNRAHNDWLEWTLEGGWPLVAVILLGVVLISRLALEAIRSESPRAQWQSAAAIGLALLALHSALDYPLRTTAMAAIAALLVACLLPGEGSEARDSRRNRKRRSQASATGRTPTGRLASEATSDHGPAASAVGPLSNLDENDPWYPSHLKRQPDSQ